MGLSTIHLEAFSSLARALNFSKAASRIHITQSALSQRIKNLEESLDLTLFIRDPSGVRLTAAGERLLRYCHTKNSLEDELLSELSLGKKGELSGQVRIGTYSSILRSAILPALAPFLRKYRNVQCEVRSSEMKDLPDLLQRSEFDFIVMDHIVERANIEVKKLGFEEYVVIESKQYDSPEDVYIDNEPADRSTENFFRVQSGRAPKYRRLFMHDCYGIIDGVAQGLGRAVMPRHLVENDETVRILSGFKRQRLEVTLHYFSQPFYSRLESAVINELQERIPKFLTP